MPAPLNPNLWPSVLHDENGVPIGPLNPLPVDVTVVVPSQPNATSFATGQKNVASHGTAVILPTQAVPNGFSVSIIAKKSNTKNIYLGNSNVNAQDHTVADILAPGDVRKLTITNWDLMWIDSDVDTEGVTIISET